MSSSPPLLLLLSMDTMGQNLPLNQTSYFMNQSFSLEVNDVVCGEEGEVNTIALLYVHV